MVPLQSQWPCPLNTGRSQQSQTIYRMHHLEFQRAFSLGLEHARKWQLVPFSRRVRTLAAFGGAILLQFFGPAATGSGGVAYVERMRCDRTAEFPAFPVPNGQQTDIAEHRGEPPL